MNKKAQGLSMNVIIIAAIALLVLVILSVLLLKSGGSLNQANKCSSLGVQGADYVCVDSGESCPTDFVRALGKSCEDEEQTCCSKLG